MEIRRHPSWTVDNLLQTMTDDAMKTDQARIGFRVKGAYLAQLREVQEIMGFNTPTETVQYLAQRGLEAMSSQLAVKRTFKRFEGMLNPDEMLPLLRMMATAEGPPIKEAEKV